MRARAALALIVSVLSSACGGSPPPPAPPPVRVVAEQQANAPTVPDSPDGDDDDDDGVGVRLAHGHIEASVVSAGLAPLQDQLTACYAQRVGRRRWLGGHVALHWNVRATGEVADVAVAESDLGAWPVEKCLLAVARAAAFGKPVGGAAEFAIPLEFSARGKPMIWDDSKALRAVGAQLATLDSCALPPKPVKPPKHPGRPRRKHAKPPPGAIMPDNVTVTVYVGPRGHAQSVGFAAPLALPDEWSACAEQIALAWKLPDPRSDVAKLAIRYRAR